MKVLSHCGLCISVMLFTIGCGSMSRVVQQQNMEPPPAPPPTPPPTQTTGPPHVFFTDLDSGPSSGGENNAGVYVTVYGKNFGSNQGTSIVTIGGIPASTYKVWTDTKIAFQVPASTPTGQENISVTVNGVTTNTLPFTIRETGQIYCVSTTGNDPNTGTFAGGCWRTIQHAVDVMTAGDTTYVRQGVKEMAANDGQGSVSIGMNTQPVNNGTPGNPIALGGYPGETATIGDTGTQSCTSTNCVEGLTTYDLGVQYNYWTIFNLTLRGNNSALQISNQNRPNQGSNFRIIGNDFSCPWMNSQSGPYCSIVSSTNYVYYYGNTIHDAGTKSNLRFQEYNGAVYFSTDVNHLWVGWNTISNAAARGIQIHSSPLNGGGPADPTGYNQFDIHIHDNIIHDTGLDGIGLATVDPSQGPVEVYNNIIYTTGKGPHPPSGGGQFAGINVAGATNDGPPGSGTVELYNNTLFDNADQVLKPDAAGWAGAITIASGQYGSPNLGARLRNNIIYNTSGVPYFLVFGPGGECSMTCSLISGSNNHFFGSGFAPSNPNLTASVNADPKFVNLAGRDFHLTAGSPAVNAGTTIPATTDFDGLPRPQGSAYSIGAYEYQSGG